MCPEIHGTDLASNFGPAAVGKVAEALIDALDRATKWTFSLTAIHKPYLATTKFVDTVFDNGENLAVRPQWYIHENLRHAICCTVDDMLTPLQSEALLVCVLEWQPRGPEAVFPKGPDLPRSLREGSTSLRRYQGCAAIRDPASGSVHTAAR